MISRAKIEADACDTRAVTDDDRYRGTRGFLTGLLLAALVALVNRTGFRRDSDP
jgi:hypothetical protein